MLILLTALAGERLHLNGDTAIQEPAARKARPEGHENLGRESTSPAAQDLYLRGRYLWNQRTEASLHQAVDNFTQAIVLDQKFAAGYAGLADSYILLRQYGHETDAAEFPRALVASERALAHLPQIGTGNALSASSSLQGRPSRTAGRPCDVVTGLALTLSSEDTAPSTINLRLAAVRRLAYEASDCGLLSPDLAAGIRRVRERGGLVFGMATG